MKHCLTYVVTCCTAYDCALFFAIRWDIDEKKSRINLEDKEEPPTFAPAFERERRTIEKVEGRREKVARRFGGNRIKPLPSRPRRHREGDGRSLRECHTTASSTSIGIERPTVVLRGDTVNE